jgi:SAM-dependent methyltransferase
MKRRTPSRPQWIREDRLPTLEDLAWLESPAGQAACQTMAEAEPADTPAAIERWRQRLTPRQVSAAWTQVLLRRAGAAKFSRAAQMLFDRVGLEQCTDEAIATHKARRFAGARRVADLCCGIGGDALALAAGRELVAVDWSAVLAEMARHNAAVYGREITARTGDVSFDWPEADAAHIDPDRRPAGRRSHDIEAGSPGLRTLERIVARYGQVAIKLSPGANFKELPFPAEIELISHHGECKQAVAWTGDWAQASRRATVLPAGKSLTALPGELLDWPLARPPEPECFLYEPDPAVIRADLVGVLAWKHGLAPVDSHVAWLVGDQAITDPLMRTFRVLDVRPWSAKAARVWLAHYDIGPLEVKTRAFAASPEAILKQVRPGGSRPGVLFLTRLENRPTAILAERLA